MKRIIALILAAMMMLSCVAFAGEETGKKEEYVSADYADALELLRLTGIVGKDFVFTDSKAKRGDFAGMLVRAKGMKEYVAGYNNNTFTDVTENDPNFSEIAAAKDMGLINGYSDGTFRPENEITLFEAAICLTRVLGYSAKAEGLGGYPAGYHSVIRETKLLDGIKGAINSPAHNADVLMLFYNALHTKVLEATEVSSEGTTLSAKNGATLLYNSFGISFTDGIVNGVDITNLYGKNDLPYYCIYVGEDVYYTETDINYLLGYHIRAYYKLEKEKTRIKLAIKDKKKNSENVVDITDIVSIEKGILKTADADGNEEKYTYSVSAPVIYNGTNTKAAFNDKIYVEDGKKLSGTVKLLDNNNDKKADVIFVDAYENMIVGRVDSEKSYVYDYFNPKRKILLSTDTAEPYVNIYGSDGEMTEVSDLTTGTSITIYKSKPDAWQTFIRVYTSSKLITGVVEKSEEINGRTYVYIDGKAYMLSDYAVENSMGVSVGRTADILLNYLGEIARFTYSTEPGDYSWAMLCAVKKTKGFEGTYLVRVMEDSGNFSDMSFNEKLIADGVEYNLGNSGSAASLIANLRKASTIISGRAYDEGEDPYCFQMIKYGINNEGKINYIDTVLDETGELSNEENLKLNNEVYFGVIDAATPEYTASVNMISQKIIVSKSYNVFMYPSEGNERDTNYYAASSTGYFVNGSKQAGLLWFKDNASDFTASVFLRQFQSSSIKGDMPSMTAYIVTKVTEAVNAEGEKRKKWYLYSRGASIEILANPELVSATEVEEDKITADEISDGDIIYYTENSANGEVEAFLAFYTLADGKYFTTGSLTYNQLEPAYAIRSTPGGIKLIFHSDAPDGIEAGVNSTSYKLFNNIHNATGITYYDVRTKKARQGNHNDIIGYLDNTDEFTAEVMARWYHPTSKIIREMIVYGR